MSLAQIRDDLISLVDAKIAAALRDDVSTATLQLGVITQISPLRVRLDSLHTPDYAPPCLVPVRAGERVVIAAWGTDMAILGPVSAGVDTGWQHLGSFTGGWGDYAAPAEQAEWCQRGGTVMIRGVVRRWGSGAGFGEVISWVPPAGAGHQLVGTAQYASGGVAPLIVRADWGLITDSVGATGNCDTSDWVRLSARYERYLP